MSEQATSTQNFSVPHPPADKLVLRDANGRTWKITVGTDGQLRTEEHVSIAVTPSASGDVVLNW